MDQYSSCGGGQFVLLELVRASLEVGFKVNILAPLGGELEVRLRQISDQISLYDFPDLQLNTGSKSWRDYIALLKLVPVLFFKHRTLFSKQDILYLNGVRYLVPIFLATTFLRSHIFLHIHLDHSRVWKLVILFFAVSSRIRNIVLISKFVESEMLSTLKSSKFLSFFRDTINSKVVRLENSLSSDFSNLPYKNRFERTQRFQRIGIFGRLSYEKGQDLVVSLAEKLPDLQFHFLGGHDFSDKSYLSESLQNPPKNVVFHGRVSNLRDAIDRIQIQVSLVPSRWKEPFGLVAIESMACSLLTITSGTGELENIAANTGALRFKDLENLDQKLRELTGLTPDKLSQIAQGQWQKTNELYDRDSYKKKFVNLLIEC